MHLNADFERLRPKGLMEMSKSGNAFAYFPNIHADMEMAFARGHCGNRCSE